MANPRLVVDGPAGEETLSTVDMNLEEIKAMIEGMANGGDPVSFAGTSLEGKTKNETAWYMDLDYETDVRTAKKIISSYTLELTDEELRALDFSAGRYFSAQVLYNALEPDNDEEDDEDATTHTFTIPEYKAWEYLEALKEEDGNLLVPPLIGGELENKLIRFLESIV